MSPLTCPNTLFCHQPVFVFFLGGREGGEEQETKKKQYLSPQPESVGKEEGGEGGGMEILLNFCLSSPSEIERALENQSHITLRRALLLFYMLYHCGVYTIRWNIIYPPSPPPPLFFWGLLLHCKLSLSLSLSVSPPPPPPPPPFPLGAPCSFRLLFDPHHNGGETLWENYFPPTFPNPPLSPFPHPHRSLGI